MKKSKPIDLSGKSIQNIMNLDIDINKLSRKDLYKVVGRLVSASNKRIRRMSQTKIGRYSPAYVSRMKHGGLFSAKGLNTNQLRQLFGETKGFLQLKTSTSRGWEKVRSEIQDRLGIDLNTQRKSELFWRTYRELVEGQNIPGQNLKSSYGSDRIQELLAQEFTKKGKFNQSREDIIQRMNEKINSLYEEQQKKLERLNRPANEVEDDDDGWMDI